MTHRIGAADVLDRARSVLARPGASSAIGVRQGHCSIIMVFSVFEVCTDGLQSRDKILEEGETQRCQNRDLSCNSLLVQIRAYAVTVIIYPLNFIEIVQRLELNFAAEDETLEEVRQGLVKLVRGVLASGNSEDLMR